MPVLSKLPAWAGTAVAATLAVALTFALGRRRRCDDDDDAVDDAARGAVPLAFSTCEVHRLQSEDGLPYKLLVSLPLDYYEDETEGGDATRRCVCAEAVACLFEKPCS